jgi:hypothetical protein
MPLDSVDPHSQHFPSSTHRRRIPYSIHHPLIPSYPHPFIHYLQEYDIWDIPEAAGLQRRYLQDHFGFGGSTMEQGSDGGRPMRKSHPDLSTHFHSTLNVAVEEPFDLVCDMYVTCM